MPVKDHTHSYVKVKGKLFGRDGYYRCADPICSHVQMKELLQGKLSLCPDCKENTFSLTAKDLRKVKPVCLGCSKTAAGASHRNIKNKLLDLFNRVEEKGT